MLTKKQREGRTPSEGGGRPRARHAERPRHDRPNGGRHGGRDPYQVSATAPAAAASREHATGSADAAESSPPSADDVLTPPPSGMLMLIEWSSSWWPLWPSRPRRFAARPRNRSSGDCRRACLAAAVMVLVWVWMRGGEGGRLDLKDEQTNIVSV